MNVNLWGPPSWQLLHGLASLTNTNNYKFWRQILESLEQLLPCPICLDSYKKFLRKDLEIPFLFISTIECMKFTYDLHNKVNEKLDAQKHREPSNPTFEVILKRAALSEHMPFDYQTVWKVLLSFSFPLRNYEDSNALAFIAFVSNLCSFLKTSNHYHPLVVKLQRLIHLLATQEYMSPFTLTIMARDDLHDFFEPAKAHIQDIYDLYAKNLPSG